MKKKPSLTFVPVLMICILLAAGHESISQSQTPKETLNDEPSLNLDEFYKSADQIEGQRSTFYERFKFNSGNSNTDIAVAAESIKMIAMLELHKVAKDAAISCANSGSDKKYATGVKIHFGKTGNKVDFFYEPVYICGETGNKEFTGGVTTTGIIYVYDGATETFKKAFSTTKEDYVASIRMNRFLNHSLKPNGFQKMYQLHKPGSVSWKRDSESIIYSFQEIFGFYHSVNEDETNADRYGRLIFIENGAANYRRTAGNFLQSWRAKHTIFITCKDLKTDKVMALGRREEGVTAKGDGANLGHLCPPSCSNLTYPLQN